MSAMVAQARTPLAVLISPFEFTSCLYYTADCCQILRMPAVPDLQIEILVNLVSYILHPTCYFMHARQIDAKSRSTVQSECGNFLEG